MYTRVSVARRARSCKNTSIKKKYSFCFSDIFREVYATFKHRVYTVTCLVQLHVEGIDEATTYTYMH